MGPKSKRDKLQAKIGSLAKQTKSEIKLILVLLLVYKALNGLAPFNIKYSHLMYQLEHLHHPQQAYLMYLWLNRKKW